RSATFLGSVSVLPGVPGSAVRTVAVAERRTREDSLRLRALPAGDSEPPEAVDAATRRMAQVRAWRREDGWLPPVESVLAGRMVRLVRCRQAVRAGAKESIAP